jgi:hypothetical protein
MTYDLEDLRQKYPYYGSGGKRAWLRLRRHKPFLLTSQRRSHFVDAGGWARPTDGQGDLEGGVQNIQAVKLLDPAKRPVR